MCDNKVNFYEFALAGNAIFTLLNPKTGNRVTYKVAVCEDKETLFFVSVLTGSDNENDFQYLGTISNGRFFRGRKSRISEKAVSCKAFAWAWKNRRNLGPVEVYHVGRCGRCGRALTTPESVESGYGPTCRDKLGL